MECFLKKKNKGKEEQLRCPFTWCKTGGRTTNVGYTLSRTWFFSWYAVASLMV
ncbi:MAG: hypothetical protein KatS3mg031_1523 [Chitinophagales bacterium]|nr:MAG: hypothetical protein KatS3mg031_1523 [Chitinophagales bacterium]